MITCIMGNGSNNIIIFFCQSIKLDPLHYVIVNAIYRIILYIVQVTTNVIKLATSWLIVVPAIISSTCILVLIEKKLVKKNLPNYHGRV